MATTSGYFMLDRRVRVFHRQHGVVLITVLLIIAVITAIITRLAFSDQIWIRKVENSSAQIKAAQAQRAAQHWVTLLLEQDTNGIDGSSDSWARPLPPIPLGDGFLYGHMEDMQARFNLNNLVDDRGTANEMAVERFVRLLEILELNPGIALAVIDWIDADDIQSGAWGAEDTYYNSLSPPYHTANQPFNDAAELRLVRGVDQASWILLEPFVTALPQQTGVNINTAGAEVLAAVLTEWGPSRNALDQARYWTRNANREPVRDLETFSRQALSGRKPDSPGLLTIDSNFFLAHIRLSYGNVEQWTATLYYRSKTGRAVILSQNREFQ